MSFTPDELETCLKVLQQVAGDTSIIDANHRFKALVAKVHARGRKAVKRRLREADRQADRAAAEETGVVAGLAAPPASALAAGATAARAYRRPVNCYVCKAPFVTVDPFYHLLCPACAGRNADKRTQR